MSRLEITAHPENQDNDFAEIMLLILKNKLKRSLQMRYHFKENKHVNILFNDTKHGDDQAITNLSFQPFFLGV